MSLLPSFIGYFNGLYAFIGNIGSIFNSIGAVPDAPPESSDYSEIVDWMNETSGDIDNINNDLSSLIISGGFTQSQLAYLLSIQNDQSQLLNNINGQLKAINQMLRQYLPQLLAGIEVLQAKNNEILASINLVIARLDNIEYKIDELQVATNLSISITQVSESYEKLKSICNNFYSLLNKMNDIDDITALGVYMRAFYIFCSNISIGGANDLSMYFDSIHSILMGNGLDKNSLYESYTEYSAYNSLSLSSSSELYQLYCQMVQLQISAYSVYAINNKFLNMPAPHLEALLNPRLESQKEVYFHAPYRHPNFKIELDYYSSQLPPEKTSIITGVDNYRRTLIKADRGKLLLSLKVDSDGKLHAYQGRMINFQLTDVDVVKGSNIQNLFYSGSSAKYYSGFCYSAEPNKYIRAIGVNNYNDLYISIGTIDDNGNRNVQDTD